MFCGTFIFLFEIVKFSDVMESDRQRFLKVSLYSSQQQISKKKKKKIRKQLMCLDYRKKNIQVKKASTMMFDLCLNKTN